jgi:hypothetical protein
VLRAQVGTEKVRLRDQLRLHIERNEDCIEITAPWDINPSEIGEERFARLAKVRDLFASPAHELFC